MHLMNCTDVTFSNTIFPICRKKVNEKYPPNTLHYVCSLYHPPVENKRFYNIMTKVTLEPKPRGI